MKVILKQDVKGLGKSEQMVNVNDGYARNFLIPRGMAVEASAENINVMKTRQEAEKSKRDRDLAHAKELAAKLEDITVEISMKAGDNGKLFGSITSKDIMDKLKSQFKIDIDKRKVQLEEPIKTLGTTSVEIRLYPEVSAKMAVKIVAE